MNAKPFAIRPALSADLDALHRLEVECMGGSALPLAQFRWLLEGQGSDPAFFVRVAFEESEGDPVGFIVWKRKDDSEAPTYEILDLSVGTHFREERVEHALLAEVIESGTREKMIGISVNVPRSNLAAAAFYLSHAFNLAHVVERYYDDGSAMEVFVKRLR
jgi:ribosomal protein S18 acetylase RimI-like enzyme